MKTAFIGIDILYPVLEALSRSGVEIRRIFTCDTDNITEFNTRVAAFARERGIALQRERLRQEDLIRLAEAGCEAAKERCRALTPSADRGEVLRRLAETGAALFMHQKDDGVTIGGDYYRYRAPEGTKFYKEGDVLRLGSLSFAVIETPGHTPGSVTLLCVQDGAEDRALFTGDTLFRSSCGRTDFPGSSTEDILRSLKRLAELPGDYEVLPGHGLSSTLSRVFKFCRTCFQKSVINGVRSSSIEHHILANERSNMGIISFGMYPI